MVDGSDVGSAALTVAQWGKQVFGKLDVMKADKKEMLTVAVMEAVLVEKSVY